MSNSQNLIQNNTLFCLADIEKLVSLEAFKIYKKYIEKTGDTSNQQNARPHNLALALLINKLVLEGLHQKCTGLFYLASPKNNFEHIKYSIIGENVIDRYTDYPTVRYNGTKIESRADLYDHQEIDGSKNDLCLMFMMSEPSKGGFDWGGEDEVNHIHAFSSAGNADYFENAIFKWNSGSRYSAVAKSEDTQAPIGVYVIHVNGTSLQYHHGAVNLTKQVAQSYAKFCPSLLNYKTIKNPGNGTMKMYATFSNGRIGGEALTSAEINKIQQIFTEFEAFL